MTELPPLPSSRSALEAERGRLERELAGDLSPRARRLLAIERRRVLIRLAILELASDAHRGPRAAHPRATVGA